MRIATYTLSAALSVLALCAPAHSAVLRVKWDAPGPARDGATWATARLKVQDAVSVAQSGDEIWVAAGTYVENVKIAAATPVSLYGGFRGDETARGQRTLGASATVLDGGGAATVVAIRADGVTVDNLTIRNGGTRASGMPSDQVIEFQGSGIACSGNGLKATRNIVTGNTSFGGAYSNTPAGSGAGVFCSGTNALLDGNVISANHAQGTISWGLMSRGTYQSAEGAGVYVSGAGTVLHGNTITDNTIVFTSGGTSPVCCDPFYDASSASGGGVYCSQATLRNNIIARNRVVADSWMRTMNGSVSATGSAVGGGICATGACDMRDNLIFGNTASTNGSAQGGGLLASDSIAFYGNTVADNSVQGQTSSSGAEVSFHGTFANNIIGLYPDPDFVNRPGGNYHLRPTSRFIDAGVDSAVQTGETDLDGYPRIRGAHVDMGAYESPANLRVKWDAPGPAHDGLTWATAYLKVGDALAASSPGDAIWVAAGTYTEAVTLKAYRSLLGGFAGTETAADQRNPAANVTIIDATGKDAPVVTIQTTGIETATVDGFTLQGGYGYTSCE